MARPKVRAERGPTRRMSLAGSGSPPPDGETGLRRELRFGTATSTCDSDPAAGTAAPDPVRYVAVTAAPLGRRRLVCPSPKRTCVLPESSLYVSNTDSVAPRPKRVGIRDVQRRLGQEIGRAHV